jgi:hypothetical protein
MEYNSITSNMQSSFDSYHTVSIRSNLPKIPKDYKEESLRQFPSGDFWMKKIDPSYSNDKSPTSERYEIQYTIINGSCKVKINFYFLE